MQNQVPPPEPRVVAVHFAQEQRRNNERTREQLELRWQEYFVALLDEHRHQGQQHDSRGGEGIQPLHLDHRRTCTRNKHRLQGQARSAVGEHRRHY